MLIPERLHRKNEKQSGYTMNIIMLLAIGLGLACLFGYAAHKAKQSPILGYLLAGYILGPNFPGFVADPYISEELANIGVTLLMFAVGLSFDWKDLNAVKKIAVPGALILSTISIITGAIYCVYLGETWISGLVVGLAICVSSTVVIVRVLSDQGILHTPQGHVVVGWTIVEDLISVFGLLLLPALSVGQTSTESYSIDVIYKISLLILKVACLGAGVHFIGGTLIEKILKIVSRTRSHELFTLAILACTFLIAIGSSYIFGVSLALGAFIAGSIIGRTDMSHQAAANALPMRDAFAVIFFLSMGMLFNPMAVTANFPLFFGVLTVLLIIRPLFAFLIVRIFRYPRATAFTVALAISQIGEYSFILAEEGSNLKILPDNAFDIIVASAFVTIGINPMLFKVFNSYGFLRMERHGSNKETGTDLHIEFLSNPSGRKGSFLKRAIVVGFGSVGQAVTRLLLKKKHHVVVIDQNIDAIPALKSNDIETIFGDSTQFHIMKQAQLENARLLVITTPDYAVTKSIIRAARSIHPFIKIVARTRFAADLKQEKFEGISLVCDENATIDKFVSVLITELKSVHGNGESDVDSPGQV